jgi:hypothetical protein
MRQAAEGFRKTDGYSKLLDRLQITQVRLEHIPLKQQTHALAFTRQLNKARCLQFLYMVGECGGRHRLALAHIGTEYAFPLLADLLEDLITARIRQRFGDEPDLALGKL